MPTITKSAAKVECINPNTGGRMNIDAATYKLFSNAISHALKGAKLFTYTQMVKSVKRHFQKQNIAFDGSVEWYTVTIKNDMQTKGVITVFAEKGKKLHRLM